MKLAEIVPKSYSPRACCLTSEDLQQLKVECSDFLVESQGGPIFKTLPTIKSVFRKVKVRFRDDEPLTHILDLAFERETKHISKKLVTVNGLDTYKFSEDHHSDFFIFPINGYKYIYNRLADSHKNLRNVLEALQTNQLPPDVSEELLRYMYVTTELHEGILSGAEIIIYNVPFFYAVNIKRVGCCYEELINSLR